MYPIDHMTENRLIFENDLEILFTTLKKEINNKIDVILSYL